MTIKVLAGPILRRTTKSRVCVWLATSEAMRLQLTVSDTGNNPLGTGAMDDMNPEGIQLGEHLFVHLLPARSEKPSGYPFDTLHRTCGTDAAYRKSGKHAPARAQVPPERK